MANINSIHSVCNSIVQFLRNAYEVDAIPDGEASAKDRNCGRLGGRPVEGQ